MVTNQLKYLMQHENKKTPIQKISFLMIAYNSGCHRFNNRLILKQKYFMLLIGAIQEKALFTKITRDIILWSTARVVETYFWKNLVLRYNFNANTWVHRTTNSWIKLISVIDDSVGNKPLQEFASYAEKLFFTVVFPICIGYLSQRLQNNSIYPRIRDHFLHKQLLENFWNFISC